MSKYPKGQIQTELVLSFNFLEIKAIYDYVLLVTRNIMTHFQYHNIMFFLTYGWNNQLHVANFTYMSMNNISYQIQNNFSSILDFYVILFR